MIKRSAALAVLLLASCSPAPAPRDRLYVSLEHGDAVAVIDPASRTVVQRLTPGKRPRGMMLSPDHAKLYVAVSGSPIGGPGVDEDKLPPADHRADGIAVVDLSSGKVERVLAAGSDPETFAMSPDGRTLFVSNEDTGSVSAVAVDGGRATQTSRVGDEPEGVAVTSDGARLFVACEASNLVAMLDARTLQPMKTIPIAGRPRTLLASRDGATIFAAVETAGQLAFISSVDGKLLGLLDLAKGDKSIRPMGMVEGPDGHLFVATGRAGSVIEVDPARRAIVRTISGVGARPWGVALTQDQRLLVTANGPSDDVTFVDRTTGKLLGKVGAKGSPWGFAR
ncbi:hypothetical protein ACFSCW_05135 [Sphingomonas tabacisoli]|uniref:Uncharacterized protein n=1 Tax=Sphingomonas tabacisoli TaxID=2249466 RepID=A0ABW4I134_9SPHN